MNSSKKKIVKSGAKKLTIYEAESALDHAAAFIELVNSQEEKRFGEAAKIWFDKYR